jgi:two-component system, NtrC family, sensor kinase
MTLEYRQSQGTHEGGSIVPIRRPEQESALGLLKVLLVASLVVPTLLFIGFSYITYWNAIDDTRRDLRRVSQIARENAVKVLATEVQVAARVNDLVRGMSTVEVRSSEASLHDTMARIVSSLPDISTVMIIGNDGHPLVSSAVASVPAQSDLSDRDFFSAVHDGYPGTFVSRLQLGAVTERLFFGLSTAWAGPDGARKGVIVVGVLPSVFQDFYAAMIGSDADPRGQILTLVRGDGQMILRYPSIPGSPPRVDVGNPFLESIAVSPDNGTYYNRSVVDAGTPERLFAYERVPGFPLYVVAGRSRDVIIADWARTMASHLVFGVPATLALFLVTLTALRRTRQKEEALALTAAEMRRREVAEAALMQRQRLDAVGEMTGGVAHDFNNLLTIVMGNLEMIERRAGDPRIQRLASNAMVAGKRGAEITRKLLSFSRRQFVSPENVNLNERLLEFKPLLDQAARPCAIDLKLDSDTAVVRLDPGQLETAIVNLVANARDAMISAGMGDYGRISIIITPTVIDEADRPDLSAGAYVRVSVSDTGPGMDPATAARAFEPFFTTKDVGAGTGLGLSQVYGFSRQAGGDARIVTTRGEGTTIELLLPQTEEPAPVRQTAADLVPLRHARDGEVILVVEDEPALLELAVESLRELGYATLSANSAENALELLRSADRIDVLFSDILMPGGMNGLQLSIEARRLRSGLKVLLTSGYAPAMFGQSVPEDVPLITKPYDQNKLASQMRAVLQASPNPHAG